MLKRWQELAEPSLSSCLQTIPGVYTRAQLLNDVKEEDDDDHHHHHHEETESSSTTRPNILELFSDSKYSHVPDPDDNDDLTTPPSSPIHGAQIQTSALLQQVMQRLVGMSIRTFETLANNLTINNHDDNDIEEIQKKITITPPSSPTFDGPVAPTPNTAMRAIKTSTFLRVSSLNPLTKAIATRSPGEVPSIVNNFLRTYPSRT